MLHSWRDIAIFLDASEQSAGLSRYAVQVARQHRAHLVALHNVPPSHIHPSESYARGLGSAGEVIEKQKQADAANAVIAAERVRELTAEFGVPSEFRVVWHDGFSDEVALKALSCDLIIASTPKPKGLPATWSAENLLLSTGIPVVMLPESWPVERLAKKVVIAWNRSREARRAVGDAMPFIREAEQVTIVTVDADDQDSNRGEPGRLLAEHLARHDIVPDVLSVASEGRSVADALFEQVSQLDADLMIMGAYSRPRRQELLFGGTTRTILARAPVPTLISK